MNSTNPRFANRISRLKSSPIRDSLQVIDRPSMISFALGLPALETFPKLQLQDMPTSALQYGPTEGDSNLRALIADDLTKVGLDVAPEQVLVLSGSQQGIDLAAKLLIDTGTPVLVERPTYLAALQVFQLFGAALRTFEPGRFEDISDTNGPANLVYVNPTFQNPTGYCYSENERTQLAEICDRDHTVLFEDDPYRDLAYEPACRRPVCSYAASADWIYQSSFSKTFAPGLRLGYLACSKALVKQLTCLKQAADLHIGRLSQYLVYQQQSNPDNTARLANLVSTYRKKRDLFHHYLDKHLSRQAEWDIPSGGLFYWLRLKNKVPIDTRQLLIKALEHNVAFTPGEPFFADDVAACGQFRLNFSLANEHEMDTGLAALAACISNG
jgi:2-aminoadipate transaminase